MIDQVFISGQLAKAVYRDDEAGYFIYGIEDRAEPRATGSSEIEFLLSLKAEFKELPGNNFELSVIRAQLIEDERNMTALFLALGGLDPMLSPEARDEARSAAEALLANAATAQFVKNRLLSRPAPLESTFSDSPYDTGKPLLSSIYKKLFESQSVIDDVAECWAGSLSEYFPHQQSYLQAQQAVVDSGFLADVVEAISADKADKINALVVTYALSDSLRVQVPKITHVLNAFRARILATFPTRSGWATLRQEMKRPSELDDYTELIYHTNPFDSSRRPSKLSAFESITRVQSQIVAIRDLLFSGNVALAQKYCGELLAFNLEHGERHHVGMTLCNLAKIALQANEIEMAQRLAENALRLGIEDDPIIFITHAEVLRWSGHFAEALSEYARIKELFPNAHQGFCAYAEVLKDMGRYQESLDAYDEAVKKFPYDPVPVNGRAGVLVSWGKLPEACSDLKKAVRDFNDLVSRTQYVNVLGALGRFGTALSVARETIRLSPRDISGYWSLARMLRRSWMLEPALAAYDEITTRFPDLVVGLAGKAQVLQRMSRFNDSLAIYNALKKDHPHNPTVKFGRASVLILLGATQEAVSEIDSERVQSESDWRGHYLVSVAYLRAGDLDQATSRMSYGYHATPWQHARTRYATGLGIAMLRKRQAAEAAKFLEVGLDLLDYGRKEQRHLILSHAYAELGNLVFARSVLERISSTQNQVLLDLRGALVSQYRLNLPLQKSIPVSNVPELIESKELFIAVNA
jgi:tetratricopeptide (TPR) repeat protein